jgi:hypothetical protein
MGYQRKLIRKQSAIGDSSNNMTSAAIFVTNRI